MLEKKKKKKKKKNHSKISSDIDLHNVSAFIGLCRV